MCTELSGKRILFLSPKFFNYENDIVNVMQALNAKVMFFDEKPANDFFTKVAIRLGMTKLISKKINNYYRSILDKACVFHPDTVFLLNPETVPVGFLRQLKCRFPELKIATYFWDSIRNRKRSLDYLSFSDLFFSFDPVDASSFSEIRFLSLFFVSDYERSSIHRKPIEFDISFIGTVHSDRSELISLLRRNESINSLRWFIYLYSPSKLLFFWQKVVLGKFPDIGWQDVSFRPLNREAVVDVFNRSVCVLDIHEPKQTGLTMRTIEVLGARRKLITSNSSIKTYDFFNSSNIAVFDRENPKIDMNFLSREESKIPLDVYKKYSLASWIICVLGDLCE